MNAMLQSPSLTEREQEVLILIAEGMSNKDIGNTLNISPRTVDSHRTNIRNKTGIKNLAGMIRFAYKNKLIQ